MTDLITIADKLLLDMKEAALLLGMSKRTMEQHIRSGSLRAVVAPGGTKRYFRRADLEAFVASMEEVRNGA